MDRDSLAGRFALFVDLAALLGPGLSPMSEEEDVD